MLNKADDLMLGFFLGSYFVAGVVALTIFLRKRRDEKQALKVADEVLKEVFPAGRPIIPELRRVVLTKELIDRGPVPDVPAIKWNDHALHSWLTERQFDLRVPINVSKNIQTGDVIFEQAIFSSVKISSL